MNAITPKLEHIQIRVPKNQTSSAINSCSFDFALEYNGLNIVASV